MELAERIESAKEIRNKLNSLEKYLASKIIQIHNDAFSNSETFLTCFERGINEGRITRHKANEVLEKMKQIKMIEIGEDGQSKLYPGLF